MRVGRTLSPGHPDRACDLIAETIVDEYLRRDPASILRVHVTGGRGALFVTGVVSSKADFDVGATAVRTAGMLGVRSPIEPFVALEPVGSAMLTHAMRTSRPIVVSGYATRESPEGIPATMSLSRQIAKRIEDLRAHDPEWFWLEPGFDVSVTEATPGSYAVVISCGHGTHDLGEVRAQMANALAPIVGDADMQINQDGAQSSAGLDHDIGASGQPDEPYGSAIAVHASAIGVDPTHPRKYGAWLARALARRALERSAARAVLVQAVYIPGEVEPVSVRVRDESGKSLLQPDDVQRLRYDALVPQFRHGLSADAARWGFAGESGLPWEA